MSKITRPTKLSMVSKWPPASANQTFKSTSSSGSRSRVRMCHHLRPPKPTCSRIIRRVPTPGRAQIRQLKAGEVLHGTSSSIRIIWLLDNSSKRSRPQRKAISTPRPQCRSAASIANSMVIEILTTSNLPSTALI